MNMPAETSRPIVVWDNVTVCDRCGGDVHVTTDGIRVAAFTDSRWEQFHGPERDGTKVTIVCGGIHADMACMHAVTVDLSTEWWTTNTLLIDRLEAEGVDIP